MKRAHVDDDSVLSGDSGVSDACSCRKGIHPLQRDGILDVIAFFCNDKTAPVEFSVDLASLSKTVFEPLLACESEEQLLRILQYVASHDEVVADSKETKESTSKKTAVSKVPNRLLDYANSPLLDQLMICWRRSKFGMGMVEVAVNEFYEDAFFFLGRVGLPLGQYLKHLMRRGQTNMVRRLLNLRAEKYYVRPEVFDSFVHCAHPEPYLETAEMLFNHPKVLIYWSDEAELLTHMVAFIARNDRLDLFEHVLRQGYPLHRFRDRILDQALRGVSMKVLRCLLELRVITTEADFLAGMSRLIRSTDEGIECIELLCKYMQPRSIDQVYLGVFTEAMNLPIQPKTARHFFALVSSQVPRESLEKYNALCLRQHTYPRLYMTFFQARAPLSDEDKLKSATQVFSTRPLSPNVAGEFIAFFQQNGVDMNTVAKRVWRGALAGEVLYNFDALVGCFTENLSNEQLWLFESGVYYGDASDHRRLYEAFKSKDPEHLRSIWTMTVSSLGLNNEERIALMLEHDLALAPAVKVMLANLIGYAHTLRELLQEARVQVYDLHTRDVAWYSEIQELVIADISQRPDYRENWSVYFCDVFLHRMRAIDSVKTV